MKKSENFGFWTFFGGLKRVNLGSKISNSRPVDVFRFLRIFSDFLDFFFEKVVFFRLSGLILGLMDQFLNLKNPKTKFFRPKNGGMQSLKKIVRAVFAGHKIYLFVTKLKSPPSREVYAHTQERWIRNFFLRLASLGERNFSLRMSTFVEFLDLSNTINLVFFCTKLGSSPCRNGYTHTQERWIRNFFLRLASLGERNFSL